MAFNEFYELLINLSVELWSGSLNHSLSQEIFPSNWKNSKIMALKKIIVPSIISDLSPIVLLYFLSTVLEKLAYDQEFENLLTKNLLDPYQNGIQKTSSHRICSPKITRKQIMYEIEKLKQPSFLASLFKQNTLDRHALWPPKEYYDSKWTTSSFISCSNSARTYGMHSQLLFEISFTQLGPRET